MRQKIDCLSAVDTCSKSQEKISTIVITTDDREVWQAFFNHQALFSSIESLEIRVNKFFSSHWQGFLIKLIKQGHLKNLSIDAKKFEKIDIFLEHLYFYSSLENLIISSKDYDSFQSLANNNAYLQGKVDQKIEKILALNKEIKQFLEIELPEYKSKIFCSHEVNNKATPSEEKILELFQLGTRYPKFLGYQHYYENLRDNAEFQSFLKVIESWDIAYLVRKKDIETIKRLYPFFQSVNLDSLLLEYTKRRLIDVAVDSKAPQIVTYLIQQGIDATFFYDKKKEETNYHFNIHRHQNFPLMVVLYQEWETANILLNHPPVYYDGLAWCIASKDEALFKDIVEKSPIKLNIDQKITAGHFTGFTLLQLLFFYQRTHLFLEQTDKFEIQNWKQLAIDTYPSQYVNGDNFEYENWSLLEIVIYQGNYDFLKMLCERGHIDLKTIALKNAKKYGLLQLLIEGASTQNFSVSYSYLDEKKI